VAGPCGQLSCLASLLGGTPGASNVRGASPVPLPPSASFFAPDPLWLSGIVCWPLTREQLWRAASVPGARTCPRGSGPPTHHPGRYYRTASAWGPGHRGCGFNVSVRVVIWAPTARLRSSYRGRPGRSASRTPLTPSPSEPGPGYADPSVGGSKEVVSSAVTAPVCSTARWQFWWPEHLFASIRSWRPTSSNVCAVQSPCSLPGTPPAPLHGKPP
jgi:hypothetical protein